MHASASSSGEATPQEEQVLVSSPSAVPTLNAEATPNLLRTSRRKAAIRHHNYREKSDEEYFETAYDEPTNLILVDDIERDHVNTSTAVNVRMQNMLMQA